MPFFPETRSHLMVITGSPQISILLEFWQTILFCI